MSEDMAPYESQSGTTKAPTAEELRVAERKQRISLEVAKIQNLPAGYWPQEWRKHVDALSITATALLHCMADNKKAHEYDDRLSKATGALERILLEMEAGMFVAEPAKKPEEK